MSQEESEKEISFDCLRTKIDEAIKTKNICSIERSEVTEKQLRYMQRYAESQVSKEGSTDSFESYLLGLLGLAIAIVALSASYFLFVVTDASSYKPFALSQVLLRELSADG